uniref:Uncharacterized protein n=1 Tax=Physcomitrium patens TaxID=3218 RepID=A0A2K1KNR9_PHYPA|nr:hypothetical protein PHYPA_006308 [Physcomitrium patens]
MAIVASVVPFRCLTIRGGFLNASNSFSSIHRRCLHTAFPFIFAVVSVNYQGQGSTYCSFDLNFIEGRSEKLFAVQFSPRKDLQRWILSQVLHGSEILDSVVCTAAEFDPLISVLDKCPLWWLIVHCYIFSKRLFEEVVVGVSGYGETAYASFVTKLQIRMFFWQ